MTAKGGRTARKQKGKAEMKRVIAIAFTAALASAVAWGDARTESTTITFDDMSFADMQKSFGSGMMRPVGPDSYKGSPKVVLKECRVYPPIGTNVPHSATFDRFKYGRKGYFTATYLVLAKNVVDLDLDDLVVESITDASGKDFTKKKNGDVNWEADPFHVAVSREAGFATFALTGGGNAWAKSLPKVKGKVSVTVAEKMATKELAGKVSSGKIGEGDYSYKVKLASSMMGNGKSLEVSPAGSKSDCELEVFCEGKKLDSTGSMTMNGKKSYSFKKPAGDDIVIKVKYPAGGKKIVIPFG